MISDSIRNASIALALANPKDFAKKKKATRLAKLKQCKLDARREQWLSQGYFVIFDVNSSLMFPVKNKGGCKEVVNGERSAFGGPRGLENKRSLEKLEMKLRIEEEIYINGLSMHIFSESESLSSNSPTSHSSNILWSNDSSFNLTARSRSSSSGRSTSCSTNGCILGSMNVEDEGGIGDDDGCFDDWEAMADALAAYEDKQQKYSPSSGFGFPVENHGNSAHCDSQLSMKNWSLCRSYILEAKQEGGGPAVQRSPVNPWAWRPDDAFRPQSLPNLSKQYTLQLKHFGPRGSVWGFKNLRPVPTSCPICYEDFDCTDSSFIPSLCGFRLCLFCHKRIIEEDGRCPGCRKQYDCDPVEGEATINGGSLTFHLTHSCSVMTRS